MKTITILLFLHEVRAQFERYLRQGREADVGLLRLPPPHLRTSYFYPTVFSNPEPPNFGLPQLPPENPPGLPVWFPPLSNLLTGPAFNYQNELITALEYPFVLNSATSDNSQVDQFSSSPADAGPSIYKDSAAGPVVSPAPIAGPRVSPTSPTTLRIPPPVTPPRRPPSVAAPRRPPSVTSPRIPPSSTTAPGTLQPNQRTQNPPRGRTNVVKPPSVS
eukprot:Gregarina_sp_Poly_1__1832@NODE_1477_length_4041_cov_215_442627_g980_i0_p3_GENE_NODE_1477_length_4041_cov_215_442627_g980_i0NODE_1477_length_4041_cov_215_442627_g980_i0_p3_ORF_typecomplete_len218_score13_00_NODE_1477_length_4041_cov_215_442627_g980_i0251904